MTKHSTTTPAHLLHPSPPPLCGNHPWELQILCRLPKAEPSSRALPLGVGVLLLLLLLLVLVELHQCF